MRARLLQGMLGLLRTQILPRVSSSEARDSAEHMERSLALMLVEAQWPGDITAEYARRAGLPPPAEDLHPAETLIRARAAAAALGCEAVAAEAWLQARLIEARNRAGAISHPDHPAGLGEAEVKAALTPHLRERTGETGLAVEAVEPIPGGRSKQTFKLRVTGAGALPPDCVLRVDRPAALVPTRAIDEYGLLQALWGLGEVAVPEPLFGEADPRVLGGSFIILRFVPGRKAGEYFPEVYGLPDQPEPICRHLARILGRLHSVDPGALPVKLPRLETAGAFGEQIEESYQRARAAGLRAAEFEAAYRWLKANLQLASAPARLCHGDVGLHNLLVEDGRITALLDWELAVLGPAALDLATIRHMVEPVMAWAEFAQDYLRAGGPPEAVERGHLDFHTVLRRFRINVSSHAAAAMFRDGVSDDFVLANAGYDMAVRTRASLVEFMAQLQTTAPNREEN